MQERAQMSHHHGGDVLIIGSGAAGLSLALHLAREQRVMVLSKGPITEGSTLYAQGGVSAVLDQQDSVQAHVRDTLEAGAGLCEEAAVQQTVSHGPESIQWLLDLGVPFTREPTPDGRVQLHLTREGGHSHRRVVHAADATGRAIEMTLVEQVRRHPNIQLFENHIAVDLITTRKLGLPEPRCLGAYVLNLDSQEVEIFQAPAVVLASGGASRVYLYSSNPNGATGDGIAMAWRAGCRVTNMEFMQFHPTCLYHPKAKSFLISEAVRGEGGRLLLPDGTPFMHRFHPRAELAPRDVVARAIDHEMKRLGVECVYLDISHQPADFVKGHFPTIYERCLEYGFDLTRDPLPVVPAAHYTCGGVMTDLKARTDLPGLYAVGEVAYTGLHGANRMASNSLLECLVFAREAARDIQARAHHAEPAPRIPPWDESRVTDSDEEVVVSHNWDELRRFMWDYVGIVRSDKRLQRALRRIELLQGEIHEYYSNFRVSNDLIELRNLALVAEIIIRSALSRRESRGLHYTIDYPQRDPALDGRPTVMDPAGTG
ncbi:L-aspartate oxidase [Ectothiorhodospira mobilis]|uniref:L-aspartate oxidase n=1 Tax=Ectothiorhodospira mobilis TaxID=195064 RepID=UPI001EE96AA9|nr:L-aspartate oxidase [Ectothiorhodospira mobilis]MCG5534978.1 L-aspartate oxidase [Ectothiorhodospira mobilis]